MSSDPKAPLHTSTIEIIERMLRRSKAIETRRASEQLGQEEPWWVTNDMLVTLGVDAEAAHLVAVLKNREAKKPAPPKRSGS